MKIFLDANILVSVLNKEYPLFTYSSRIVSLIEDRKFSVYTSPICLAIAFYFSEKKSGRLLAKKKMDMLCSNIQIAPVDALAVKSTVLNKSISDFEDGLEYYSAKAVKCSTLITEDAQDFFFADMEIIGARDFLEKYVINKKDRL